MIQRIIEVARDGGVVSLLFRALGQTVYRRLLLLETRLDRLPYEPDQRGRWLQPSEVPQFSMFATEASRELTKERFASGQRCWVVLTSEQQIGHALWVAFGTADIAYLGAELPLEPDEVYLFDSFTPPQYRGRGLASAGSRSLKVLLREQGFRRTFSCILPDNRNAYPPVFANGAEPIAYIGWFGVGPWRRTFGRATSRFPWYAPRPR